MLRDALNELDPFQFFSSRNADAPLLMSPFSKPVCVVAEYLNAHEQIRTLICFQEVITLLNCNRTVMYRQ